MAKRVSVINFKGGVGKTTLSYHLATGLAAFYGVRVLLVDMDHQSSLSVVCLGYDKWVEVADAGNAVDAIFTPFVSREHEMPGGEVIVSSPVAYNVASYQPGKPYTDGDYGDLDVVPARLELDAVEIELTAARQGDPIRSEWDRRTMMCQWIERTGVDDDYDYIIFDCPPSTKIVTQNAIAASDGYIVPVVPEAVMQRGLPFLMGMVEKTDKTIERYYNIAVEYVDEELHGSDTWVPETKPICSAIPWIRGGRSDRGAILDHTRHLRDLEGMTEGLGIPLVETYVPHTTVVSRALADSVPVYALADGVLDANKLRVRETDEDEERIDVFYENLIGEIYDKLEDL